ncbi:MAG TPA: hypothetical protein V6C50_01910, partial [Crinalium sp.]
MPCTSMRAIDAAILTVWNNDRRVVAIASCCTYRNTWHETQASITCCPVETDVGDRSFEPCLELLPGTSGIDNGGYHPCHQASDCEKRTDSSVDRQQSG